MYSQRVYAGCQNCQRALVRANDQTQDIEQTYRNYHQQELSPAKYKVFVCMSTGEEQDSHSIGLLVD